VVNVQLSSIAIAFPATSFTPGAPPLTSAVCTVLVASVAVGSRVAVVLAASYVTAAGIAVPAALRSVIVDAVTVAGFTGSENRTVTFAVSVTPDAPRAGVTAATVGPVSSTGGGAAVVNDHVRSTWSVFPARSAAPPVPPETVAV
jgi:hypothetical protein